MKKTQGMQLSVQKLNQLNTKEECEMDRTTSE
jgi:hypothetical protein